MGDLSKNFSSKEFTCGCGCGRNDIHPDLITRLQLIRERVGQSLVITSGVRCPAHNTAIGGAKRSPHPDGVAADIACGDSRLRFRIIAAALEVGINRIGIGSGFIHLDISDTSRAQQVVWLY